jgi:hypothetical protein
MSQSGDITQNLWKMSKTISSRTFTTIMHKKKTVNLVGDELSSRSVCSYDKNLEYGMTRWENADYKLTTQRCAYIGKSMYWIGTTLHNPLELDGT